MLEVARLPVRKRARALAISGEEVMMPLRGGDNAAVGEEELARAIHFAILPLAIVYTSQVAVEFARSMIEIVKPAAVVFHAVGEVCSNWSFEPEMFERGGEERG
jgi:hypothetical protein